MDFSTGLRKMWMNRVEGGQLVVGPASGSDFFQTLCNAGDRDSGHFLHVENV